MPKKHRPLGYPYMRTPEQIRAHTQMMLDAERERFDNLPEDRIHLKQYLSRRISELTRILNE